MHEDRSRLHGAQFFEVEVGVENASSLLDFRPNIFLYPKAFRTCHLKTKRILHVSVLHVLSAVPVLD